MRGAEEPPSLQEIIESRQARAFVGREGPVTSFTSNLDRGADDPNRSIIFAIDGQAGAGKSYLTKRLCHIAKRNRDLVAVSDDEADDVLQLLESIAIQLHDLTGMFAKYLQLAARYRSKRDSMATDADAPAGVGAVLTNASVRLGLGAAKVVPGIGDILDGIEPDVAAEQVETIRTYLAKRFRKTADSDLVLNPIPALSRTFLLNLRQVAIDYSNVVLAIDTFERRSDQVQRWLIELLNGTHGPVPSNLLLIIAGQHTLNANQWATFSNVTERVTLREFNESETSALLNAYGAIGSTDIARVMEITGGLPVLVGMLGQNTTESLDDVNSTETAVERFLRHEQDSAKRDIILKAAAARYLDSRVLAVLLGDGSEEEVLAWLTTYPFIRRQGSRWSFHGVVRTMMIRYQRDRAPEKHRQIHQILTDYHFEESERTSDNSNWETDFHRVERAYHRLCSEDHAAGLEAILERIAATSRTNTPMANRLVSALGDAAADLLSDRYSALHSSIASLLGQNSAQGREQLCSFIINEGAVTGKQLARLYRRRARVWIFELDLPELGMADCNKSMLAYSDSASTLLGRALRAQAYKRMGRFADCIADLDWCLAERPDDGYYLHLRSRTLQAMQRYEEAERDISAAITAHPENASYRSRRASLLFGLNRDDDALNDLTAAIEESGELGYTRYRADIYRFCRRYEDALADLELIDARKPIAVDHVRHGEVLRLIGRPAEALPFALRGAAGDDIAGWSYLSVGLIYRNLDDPTRAAENFERALQIGLTYLRQNGEDVPALFNTAMAYTVLGLRRPAEELIRNLGRSQMSLEQVRQARTLHQEIVDVGLAHDVSIDPAVAN